MKSVYLSLPDIIEELRALGKAKASGSFFIVSDEQHSSLIGFEKGRIVSLQSRLRFGEKAIPLLGRIKNGACRFEQTSSFVRRVSFADNEELFREILSVREQDGELDTRLDSTSVGGQQLSDKQKKEIEVILVDELGPMGSIVSDSIEHCSNLGEIMEIVKREVDGPDIVNAIEKKIRRVLK